MELLNDWVTRNGGRRVVAEKLGISPRYLEGLCQGRAKPGADLAIDLQRLSGGELTVELLRGRAEPATDQEPVAEAG